MSVVYCSYQVIIFLRAEENMGKEKKPKDKKTAREENKQFDHGGKGGEPAALKSGCTGIDFFPGGTLGLGARCLCFALSSLLVCLLCIVLIR